MKSPPKPKRIGFRELPDEHSEIQGRWLGEGTEVLCRFPMMVRSDSASQGHHVGEV